MTPRQPDIVIRRLREEDAESVCEIFRMITKRSPDENFKQLVYDHAQDKKGCHFVALLGGRVVAFMINYILTLGFGAEKHAWIAVMGVNPKFMGQGIGAHMAREAFEYFQREGIKTVYATVRWDSTDLLSFLKGLGFEKSDYLNLKKELA
ncbi:Ribosomal protein S18 acetylase RimI [Desulfacinum infernum DSM 9756]|uniref:Ribosomal protein S18 acetylase RimI n=1 Tax=Desulfacinum infernum DSM 9756 TaxID=1121391 RepID=A0A1M5G7I8_9BACT|nr:GNAT family N-acetyltransferase [Desulfacinum infernum]SHF99737.1 Ribosomal protein S18 acetylase RimI [Desulfacinum infernum DSM 9756]